MEQVDQRKVVGQVSGVEGLYKIGKNELTSFCPPAWLS